MHEFWHLCLHALKDTAVIIPILLVVYFFIEFLEYKRLFRFNESRLLKGKASPIFGALFGCVPQCGFSVISTDMYTKKELSIGALIAVYIATSDETIPIMLSHPKSIPALLALIGIKIVYAVMVGCLAMWLHKLIFKQKTKTVTQTASEHTVHEHNHDEHLHAEIELDGCCKHHLNETRFDWKHPLIHSLKIALFILIANFVVGLIMMFVGEDSLTAFLSLSFAWQPVLAVIIGLIPNCVSSVVLTELFLFGGLSFGALVAGLCVNAGIGLLMLFKHNKNIKENLFIVLTLIISGLAIGYALHFVPLF